MAEAFFLYIKAFASNEEQYEKRTTRRELRKKKLRRERIRRTKYEESEIRKKKLQPSSAAPRTWRMATAISQRSLGERERERESLAPMCLSSARNAQRVPLQSARSQREYTQCELIFAEYFGNSRHRKCSEKRPEIR